MKTTVLLLALSAALVPAVAQQGQIGGDQQRDIGSVLRSGIDAFLGGQQEGQVSLQQVTAEWHESARAAAKAMFEKYGAPQEVTPHRLVWRDNRPWKSTTVLNQEVPHNFPVPHNDVLIQTLAIDVPADRIADLAQFDGSITVNRTAGELTVSCDREEHNLIALNLASDLINGNLNVAQARQRLAELAEAVKNGQQPSYASDVRFNLPVSTRTGDADQPHGSARGNWQRIGW
jgi:hypothetical protein